MEVAFDRCDVETQAMILAYGQIREYEETKFQAALAGAKLS